MNVDGSGYFQNMWKSHPETRKWLYYRESSHTAFCKCCKIEITCTIAEVLEHAVSKQHLDAYNLTFMLGGVEITTIPTEDPCHSNKESSNSTQRISLEKVFEILMLDRKYRYRCIISKKTGVDVEIVNKIVEYKEHIQQMFRYELDNIKAINFMLKGFVERAMAHKIEISDEELMQKARFLSRVLCVKVFQIDENWPKFFRISYKPRPIAVTSSKYLEVNIQKCFSVREILKDLQSKVNCRSMRRFKERLRRAETSGDLILKCSALSLEGYRNETENAISVVEKERCLTTVEPQEIQIKEEIEVEESMLQDYANAEMMLEPQVNDIEAMMADDSNELIEIYAEVDGDDEEGEEEEEKEEGEEYAQNMNVKTENEEEYQNDFETNGVNFKAGEKLSEPMLEDVQMYGNKQHTELTLTNIKEEPIEEVHCEQPNAYAEYDFGFIKPETELSHMENSIIASMQQSMEEEFGQSKEKESLLNPAHIDIKSEPTDTYYTEETYMSNDKESPINDLRINTVRTDIASELIDTYYTDETYNSNEKDQRLSNCSETFESFESSFIAGETENVEEDDHDAEYRNHMDFEQATTPNDECYQSYMESAERDTNTEFKKPKRLQDHSTEPSTSHTLLQKNTIASIKNKTANSQRTSNQEADSANLSFNEKRSLNNFHVKLTKELQQRQKAKQHPDELKKDKDWEFDDVIKKLQYGDSLREQQVSQIGKILNAKRYGELSCDILWLDPIVCSYMLLVSYKPSIFSELALVKAFQVVLGDNFSIQAVDLMLYRHVILLAYSTKFNLDQLNEIMKNILNKSDIRSILSDAAHFLENWRLFLEKHVISILYRKALYEILFEFERRYFLLACHHKRCAIEAPKRLSIQSIKQFLRFDFSVGTYWMHYFEKNIKKRPRITYYKLNTYTLADLSLENIYKDIQAHIPDLVVENLKQAQKSACESLVNRNMTTSISQNSIISEEGLNSIEVTSPIEGPVNKRTKIDESSDRVERTSELKIINAADDSKEEESPKDLAHIFIPSSDSTILCSNVERDQEGTLEIAPIRKFEIPESLSKPQSLISVIHYDPIIAEYLFNFILTPSHELPIFHSKVLEKALNEVLRESIFEQSYVCQAEDLTLYRNLLLLYYYNNETYKPYISRIMHCFVVTTMLKELGNAANIIREWQKFFKKHLAKILYKKAIFEMLYEFTRRYLRQKKTICDVVTKKTVLEIQRFFCCYIPLSKDWLENFKRMYIKRESSQQSSVGTGLSTLSLSLNSIYKFVKHRFNYFVRDTLKSSLERNYPIDIALVDDTVKEYECSGASKEKLNLFIKELGKDPIIIKYLELLNEKKCGNTKLPIFNKYFLKSAIDQTVEINMTSISTHFYQLYRQLIMFKFSQQCSTLNELSTVMRGFSTGTLRQLFGFYEDIFQQWRKFSRKFLVESVIMQVLHEMLYEYVLRVLSISHSYPTFVQLQEKMKEIKYFFGHNFDLPANWLREFFNNVMGTLSKKQMGSVNYTEKDLRLEEIYLSIKERLHWLAIEKREAVVKKNQESSQEKEATASQSQNKSARNAISRKTYEVRKRATVTATATAREDAIEVVDTEAEIVNAPKIIDNDVTAAKQAIKRYLSTVVKRNFEAEEANKVTMPKVKKKKDSSVEKMVAEAVNGPKVVENAIYAAKQTLKRFLSTGEERNCKELRKNSAETVKAPKVVENDITAAKETIKRFLSMAEERNFEVVPKTFIVPKVVENNIFAADETLAETVKATKVVENDITAAKQTIKSFLSTVEERNYKVLEKNGLVPKVAEKNISEVERTVAETVKAPKVVENDNSVAQQMKATKVLEKKNSVVEENVSKTVNAPKVVQNEISPAKHTKVMKAIEKRGSAAGEVLAETVKAPKVVENYYYAAKQTKVPKVVAIKDSVIEEKVVDIIKAPKVVENDNSPAERGKAAKVIVTKPSTVDETLAETVHAPKGVDNVMSEAKHTKVKKVMTKKYSCADETLPESVKAPKVVENEIAAAKQTIRTFLSTVAERNYKVLEKNGLVPKVAEKNCSAIKKSEVETINAPKVVENDIPAAKLKIERFLSTVAERNYRVLEKNGLVPKVAEKKLFCGKKISSTNGLCAESSRK